MDTDTEMTGKKEDAPTNNVAGKPPPKGRKGKNGKSNYTREELLALFDVMEQILPIGTEELEQVLLDHSEKFPGRDVKSIQRKYNTLHRKQFPTELPSG